MIDANTARAEDPAKELKRRCEMMAATARLSNAGEAICVFCGKPIGSRLRDHLRRRHAVKVAELPADSFI